MLMLKKFFLFIMLSIKLIINKKKGWAVIFFILDMIGLRVRVGFFLSL